MATTTKRHRTPTVLQMEAVECGAASLAMILGGMGLFRPLAELRYECGVSRDGSKAANVLKAARRYGVESKGYKKELGELRAMPLPFIAFWNFNHFLVVEGWGRGIVYLNDPASGPRTVTDEEFDSGYTGVVLTFVPGPDFKQGGRKPNVLPNLLARLNTSVPAVTYCFLAALFMVLPSLAGPIFTQVFVDSVLVQGLDDWLRPLLAGMVIASVLTAGLSLLRSAILNKLHTKLSVSFTGGFLWHALRLPVGFYAQRFAGEIAGRVPVNEEVSHAISGPIAGAFVNVVMVVLYAAVMISFDPVLTLIGVSFAAFNFVVVKGVNRWREDAYTRLGIDYGKAGGTTIAGLQSIETLKASGLESDFFSRWAGYYAKAMNTQAEMGARDALISAVPTLLQGLAALGVLVVGGLRVMDGHLSIGMLVAFQSLMHSFMEPMGSLVELGSTLTKLTASMTRLDDVLGNAIDPQTVPSAGAMPGEHDPVRLSGQVEIKNVSFGYSRLEPPLIEGFSLTLTPGQRVAFVGGSGSGKSTVAKLVTGLYDPWEGEILFDGRKRTEWARAVLTNSIAMVDQDLFLISGTVRENLTLWDETITDRDLTEACTDADILDVVAAMPGGLDALLLEGAVNLSGGQRQRLEIARALARDPAILVLDEATSALDTQSEKVVDRNLRKRGCTCIIVAHRLSTVRDCDEIIVFERGKVVQRGTHDALKSQPGHYASLIEAEHRRAEAKV
ncbi:MAG: bacteriocin system transporter, peptidase/ATP-binding protein [Cyanobacteria bacterium RYN_339]|nr:bacteriocin system transporter, peptidase/ATP-binding protein [Cyanobacteria bacterium RYN_339]